MSSAPGPLIIAFLVPGPPVPWARAARKGKGHSFTPPRQAQYKQDVQWMARAAMKGRPPLQGPVALDIEFALPVPLSYSKAKRQACLEGDLFPTGKPDVDNLAKIIKDALNTIAYVDDSQVVGLKLKKYYSATPGAALAVATVPAD